MPVEFEITGGEVNDCSAAPELIARLPDAKAIVADKGYDSECIREQITKKGARAVIPRKRNSLKGNWMQGEYGSVPKPYGNPLDIGFERDIEWCNITARSTLSGRRALRGGSRRACILINMRFDCAPRRAPVAPLCAESIWKGKV